MKEKKEINEGESERGEKMLVLNSESVSERSRNQ